jgi:hypothetical protein
VIQYAERQPYRRPMTKTAFPLREPMFPNRMLMLLSLASFMIALVALVVALACLRRFATFFAQRDFNVAATPAVQEKQRDRSASILPGAIPAIPDYREYISSNSGEIPWIGLSSAQGFEAWHSMNRPCWSLDKGAILGDSDESLLMIGDSSWKDYELSMNITCERGGCPVVRLRSPDGKHGYLINLLYGLQAIAVRSIDGHSFHQVSVVDASLVQGRSYELRVAMRGESLTTYLDHALMNQVTVSSWSSGGIGIGVWQSRVRFDQVRVRFLDECPWRLTAMPQASVPTTSGF